MKNKFFCLIGDLKRTKSSMSAEIVPQDLNPIKDISINQMWATNTIKYRSVFNNAEQISIATQSHLDEWQKEARKIS